MKKNLAVLIFSLILVSYTYAQSGQLWHGRKCAVVLTYDDGLNVHLDNVIPLLDSLGLKGTFYIPGNSLPFANKLNEWRKAAEKGHELGNHTLFHPCNGSLSGREWVSKDHDLNKYSLQQIADEVRLANTLLKAVDGKSKRTFAYTCGDMEVEGQLFYNEIKNEFVAARGVYSKLNRIETIDLSNINSYMINGETGEELIKLIEKALDSGSLLVFLFHGVGGEHALNVSLPAHRKLLRYLKEKENKIWTATMFEVANHITEIKKL